MQRQMRTDRDVICYHKPCMSKSPERCLRSDDKCTCTRAHSEEKFQEWEKRLLLVKERESYREPSMEYIADLRERMENGQMQEMKNYFPRRVIEMETTETIWTWNYKVPGAEKTQSLEISILQPDFKVKLVSCGRYVQHLCGLDSSHESIPLLIRFQNPGIFGQHSGTLVFDYGKDTPVHATSFNVTIKGSRPTEQRSMQTEILTQNWNTDRIIIPYPELPLSEGVYEAKVKRLEKKYKPVMAHEAQVRRVDLENLTPENYSEQMHDLLYKEESARQGVLSRLNIECWMNIESNIFAHSGSFMGSRNDGGLFGSFLSPMRLSTDSDEGILVRDSCSKVLIGVKEGSAVAYECKIEQWEGNQVYISLSPRCVSDLKLKHGTKMCVVVQYQLDRNMFSLRHYAIDRLEERTGLICPRQMTCAKLNFSTRESKFLDDNQNKVLKHIYATKIEDRHNSSPECFPPLVIAGPFGTGKTHTIRNVILDILDRNGTNSKILLCTHSNSAADLYIKNICDDPRWHRWTGEILRVMSHRRDPRTVLVSKVLDYCLFADAGRSRFRYPTSKELVKYRIIITTFSTSPALGQLSAGLRDGDFTHIFLDEASQAIEPEVIMPLTLASFENTRIIIAGDHRQINERMFFSGDAKIPTLLERVYNAYDEKHKKDKLLLCNNYRCVDGLLQLISFLFYKFGMLKRAGDDKLLPGYHPVHFIHIQGECKVTDAGDFINESEAHQVVQQVQDLLASGIVKEEDIMVSAPYHMQIQLIRELLRGKGWRKVSAYPARNVQALQFKVVMFSCVMRRVTCLSCIGENFGFLSDANLLNTVLTRAKSLVVAIGDAVTLCSTGSCREHWDMYLQYCWMSRTIHPFSVDMPSLQRDICLARLPLRSSAKEFVPRAMRGPKSVEDSPHFGRPLMHDGCIRPLDVSMKRMPVQKEEEASVADEFSKVKAPTVLLPAHEKCAKHVESPKKSAGEGGKKDSVEPQGSCRTSVALLKEPGVQKERNCISKLHDSRTKPVEPPKRSPEQKERKRPLKPRKGLLKQKKSEEDTDNSLSKGVVRDRISRKHESNRCSAAEGNARRRRIEERFVEIRAANVLKFLKLATIFACLVLFLSIIFS